MSLRKSPTRTPALLAANRRNAKKSTGPRTARGKAWTRFNSLRHGLRSPEYIQFRTTLLDAPAGRVERTATILLAARQIRHPIFLEAAEEHLQAEIEISTEARLNRARKEREKGFV